MATYAKKKLSTTDDGNIPRSLNASSGLTLVHATGISATIQDEIWLYVSDKTGGGGGSLRVDFYSGPGSAYNGFFVLEVPANSTILSIAGLPLSGDGANATEVYLTNQSINDFTVHGFVNRITP